jgi:Flp pilus assembly protein TadD
VAAASGWLGLGLPREAEAELARVAPSSRRHPAFLAMAWDLHAHVRDWERALEVAMREWSADPTEAIGWVHRAYALHELKRTEEAIEALTPAMRLFPSLGLIPYNLACYACQLGRMNQARDWLRRAMEVDGRDVVVKRARVDVDLAPLAGELDQV